MGRFYGLRGLRGLGAFGEIPTTAELIGDIVFTRGGSPDIATARSWRGAGVSQMGFDSVGQSPGVWFTNPNISLIATSAVDMLDASGFYSPLPEATVLAARANYQRLKDHVDLQSPSSARAAARLDQLHRDLAPLVKRVDDNTFSWANATDYLTKQSATFGIINTLVSRFAAESWPDPVEELDKQQANDQAAQDAAVKARAAQAATTAQRDQTRAEIAKAQAAIAAQEARARGGSGPSPIVIAAVGVPLVLVAAFMLTRKKSSVSGYRRRRRRR